MRTRISVLDRWAVWCPSRRHVQRFLLDVGVLSVALALAYGLRFDWKLEAPYARQALLAWPTVVSLQYVLMTSCRMPRFSWSHFSLPEVRHTARAIGLSALVLLLVRLVGPQLAASVEALDVLVIPVSVILIDAVLALLGLTWAADTGELVWPHSKHGAAHMNVSFCTH